MQRDATFDRGALPVWRSSLRWTAAIAAIALLPSAASAQPEAVQAKIGAINVETIADGLVHPWALAFLPDARMLVTERPGRLRIVSKDGEPGEPLDGVPEVFARGQGGLLDVVLDPDFAGNSLVYLSFAEPGEGGASTAVARGRLQDDALEDTEVIFRQQPKVEGENHFGGRLAFSPEGQLFVTMGERFKFEPAQDLSSHLGTIARINPDGTVPDDNPFVDGGSDIPDPPTRPEFAQSIYHWNPVISPSGMIFYTGDLFSEWQGNVLIGGLSSKALVRLTVDGEQVTGEEQIDMGVRIREVAQGPDGAVYLLTDQEDGEILRLSPQ